MKKIQSWLIGLLALVTGAAHAQFAPGQILTAAQLNSAFANVLPIAGGTLTGPLTVPTLTATTALNTAHAAITGGTITGLATPLPFASGGTNANSQAGALAAILGASAVPIANGGTNATNAAAATQNLQFLSSGIGAIAYSVATKLGNVIDVADFGALCSGTSNDTAALQNALAYAQTVTPAVVRLPKGGLCGVTGTLTLTQAVSLTGQGQWNSGLIALTTNLAPMLKVTGNAVTISNLYVNALNAGANASGWVIQTASATSQLTLRDISIHGPCGAIDISGNYHTFDNVFIDSAQGTNCQTLRIGNLTTNAGSTDISLNKVTVSANPSSQPDACLLLQDAGGLFLSNIDMQICNTGTKILPGPNQWVAWTTGSNSYLGDTNGTNGVVFDTGAATSIIEGFSCTNCWASSAVSGDGIQINNTGAGTVTGLHFIGLRALSNHANGFNLNTSSATDVTIDASHICAYGASAAGFAAVSGAGEFAIRNTELRPNCENRPSSGGTGVFMGGSNANVALTNLDTRGNTVNQIAGTPTGSSIVYGLRDLDANAASVASAASVTLNAVYETWLVTGTTSISTINGAWAGREARLITTSGAIAFSTGGNICNAITSAQNVPVSAIYLGSCWYLK